MWERSAFSKAPEALAQAGHSERNVLAAWSAQKKLRVPHRRVQAAACRNRGRISHRFWHSETPLALPQMGGLQIAGS
jgi:hypothetical protein